MYSSYSYLSFKELNKEHVFVLCASFVLTVGVTAGVGFHPLSGQVGGLRCATPGSQ